MLMSSNNPKVSIIMPAYNTQAYIAKAIESALMQTEKDIELIIVNDCSDDDTLKIAQSFTDERVKVFSNSQCFGKSYCCNFGIERAKGEWITSLDSDDWYTHDRIEKLLLHASNIKNVDIITDDLYYICDGEKQAWSTFLAQSKVRVDSTKHIDIAFYLNNDLPTQWSLSLGITKPLFKRVFLINHNIRYKQYLKRSDDFWFLFTCLVYGANFFLFQNLIIFIGHVLVR